MIKPRTQTGQSSGGIAVAVAVAVVVAVVDTGRCPATTTSTTTTFRGYRGIVVTAYQLKIIQEIITLVVFTGFAAAWLGETPRWNMVVAFFLIVAATGFAFLPHHT